MVWVTLPIHGMDLFLFICNNTVTQTASFFFFFLSFSNKFTAVNMKHFEAFQPRMFVGVN